MTRRRVMMAVSAAVCAGGVVAVYAEHGAPGGIGEWLTICGGVALLLQVATAVLDAASRRLDPLSGVPSTHQLAQPSFGQHPGQMDSPPQAPRRPRRSRRPARPAGLFVWHGDRSVSPEALAGFDDDEDAFIPDASESAPPAPVLPLLADPPARRRSQRAGAVLSRDGTWTPARTSRHVTSFRLVSDLPSDSAGVAELAGVLGVLTEAPGVSTATAVVSPGADLIRWTLEISGRASRAMVHLDHLHSALSPALLIPDESAPPAPPSAKERREARRKPPEALALALATAPGDLRRLAAAMVLCCQLGVGVVVVGQLVGGHPRWNAWAVCALDPAADPDVVDEVVEGEAVRQLIRLEAAGVVAVLETAHPERVLEAWRSSHAA